MSKPPPEDAKAAISQQLNNIEFGQKGRRYAGDTRGLEKFGEPGEMGLAAVYVAANVIKNDVSQYEPWTSSWGPIGAGGWYSSEYILEHIAIILRKLEFQGYKPEVSDKRVSRTTPNAIPCNVECQEAAKKDKCLLRAKEMFGPAGEYVPGAAQLACQIDENKTKLYVLAGLVGLTLVAGVALIFRPYVSIASSAFSKKPKNASYGRRK